MNQTDWTKEDGDGEYRIQNKTINPVRLDKQPCVLKTSLGNYEAVADEIAHKVKEIIDSGRVNNPNEVAFLFPSLKRKVCPSNEEITGKFRSADLCSPCRTIS
ncbi:hypothetical protein ACT7DP_15390 [Bacillus paranthracis]